MNETMRQGIAKFKGWSGQKRILMLSIALVLIVFGWFAPWVLTVPLGFSIYFPYKPDGVTRTMAAVGPVAGSLGLSKWVSAKEIPEVCRAAVVAAEDTKFYEHAGLDWDSIKKAQEANAKHNGKKFGKPTQGRGASTLTQQLIKNLYLSRDRSYLRKVREALGSVTLEFLVSKETILTWYLNVVEFGPNVYGLQDAAHFYFKKSAEKLQPHECVSLAVILPSPNKWNVSLVNHAYTSFFVSRYTVVSKRMQVLAQVPQKVIAQVRRGAPFYVEQAPEKTKSVFDLEFPSAVPGSPEFTSTLDNESELPQSIPVSPLPEASAQFGASSLSSAVEGLEPKPENNENDSEKGDPLAQEKLETEPVFQAEP